MIKKSQKNCLDEFLICKLNLPYDNYVKRNFNPAIIRTVPKAF